MRRRLALLICAFTAFFIAINEGLIRRLFAVLMCGVFGITSVPWIPSSVVQAAIPPRQEITISTTSQVEASNTTIEDLSTLLPDEAEQISQFKLPLGKELNNVVWGLVSKQLLKSIGGEVPIVSNQPKNELFPTVNVLPSSETEAEKLLKAASSSGIQGETAHERLLSQPTGGLPGVRRKRRGRKRSHQSSLVVSDGSVPFNPTGDVSDIIRQLRSSPDGSVKLLPGDYAIPVRLYCMKERASSPPGHRYILGQVKGSKANLVTTLHARAAGLNLPYKPMQVLSWNIQAGMAYDDMPTKSRELVDQLIPDYRNQLSRGLVEQIESSYNSLRGVSGLPSLNRALRKLGPIGQVLREYKRFQGTLRRYSNNYDRLFSTLIPQGRSNRKGGATSTPWSRIDNRVYGRMVTTASAGGTGTLMIRVLPKVGQGLIAVPHPGAKLAGTLVLLALGTFIADSEIGSVQSLMMEAEQPKEILHRGRIQAQGNTSQKKRPRPEREKRSNKKKKPGLEISRSWNQSTPLTLADGLAKLDEVWNSLTPKEQRDLSGAYKKAQKYIKNAGSIGGIDAQVFEHFYTKQGKDGSARIDIEVIKGKAFVP